MSTKLEGLNLEKYSSINPADPNKKVLKPEDLNKKPDLGPPAGDPNITTQNMQPAEAVKSAENGIEINNSNLKKGYELLIEGYKERINILKKQQQALGNIKNYEEKIAKLEKLLKDTQEIYNNNYKESEKNTSNENEIVVDGFVKSVENFTDKIDSEKNNFLQKGWQYIKSLVLPNIVTGTLEQKTKFAKLIKEGKTFDESLDVLNKESAQQDFEKITPQTLESIDQILKNIKDFDKAENKIISQNIVFLEKKLIPNLEQTAKKPDYQELKNQIVDLTNSIDKLKDNLKHVSLIQKQWQEKSNSWKILFDKVKNIFSNDYLKEDQEYNKLLLKQKSILEQQQADLTEEIKSIKNKFSEVTKNNPKTPEEPDFDVLKEPTIDVKKTEATQAESQTEQSSTQNKTEKSTNSPEIKSSEGKTPVSKKTETNQQAEKIILNSQEEKQINKLISEFSNTDDTVRDENSYFELRSLVDSSKTPEKLRDIAIVLLMANPEIKKKADVEFDNNANFDQIMNSKLAKIERFTTETKNDELSKNIRKLVNQVREKFNLPEPARAQTVAPQSTVPPVPEKPTPEEIYNSQSV